MIKVASSITVYNDVFGDIGDGEVIVQSHDREGFVVLSIGNCEYLVKSRDLLAAINNATRIFEE